MRRPQSLLLHLRPWFGWRLGALAAILVAFFVLPSWLRGQAGALLLAAAAVGYGGARLRGVPDRAVDVSLIAACAIAAVLLLGLAFGLVERPGRGGIY